MGFRLTDALVRGGSFRGKVGGMFALLAAANVGAWAWAFMAFHDFPVLMGTAALAYSFGLRHAFDADHIAAIDNVTRKLMRGAGRPVGVGLYFSLGHSTVVFALTIALALAATSLHDRFETLKAFGAAAGTIVSALFLFAIAAANIPVLLAIARAFDRAKAGGTIAEEDIERALSGRGLMGRLFRRVYRIVERSAGMYWVGLMFGLGFDTATEVGLLGISALQAAQGLPIWSILVFPALFTAGMSLIDAADSVVMVGAYRWAFVKPVRKLYYNLTITAASVLVAALVGALEALNFVGDRLGLIAGGGFWGWIGSLNDNFGLLGVCVVGVFAASWLLSAIVYRLKGYDALETALR